MQRRAVRDVFDRDGSARIMAYIAMAGGLGAALATRGNEDAQSGNDDGAAAVTVGKRPQHEVKNGEAAKEYRQGDLNQVRRHAEVLGDELEGRDVEDRGADTDQRRCEHVGDEEGGGHLLES